MPDYITIDSGTTNTRISLVKDYQTVQTLRFDVGAKKGIENKALLKDTIKKGIWDILKQNALCESDISCILACGMITSEFGLVELEHITIPAGIKELKSTMYKCKLEEISSIPFVFIRGLKTKCTSLEDADMLRGEESELSGISAGEGIYVLPGSHTKIMKLDADNRITDFKTMLTGEMLSSIANHTILKDSVKLKDYILNKEYLLKGCKYAQLHGLSEALFKVRTLKNIFGASDEELYSFYMGIMLSGEVNYIVSQAPVRVVIGGQSEIKECLALLIKETTNTEIKVLSASETERSSITGMIKIYEYEN